MATSFVPSSAAADPVSAELVTTANYPAMFTVAADGRIFFSELATGRIGVFNPADGSSRTYFTVPNLCTGWDKGLYGLAFHPSFPQPSSLYAYATRLGPDGACHNQVLRIDAPETAPSLSVLLDDPYTGGHIGGRVLFGPDGNLYVATGDGSSGAPSPLDDRTLRARVQDGNSFKGKVLRMTPAGGVPADNPFPNNFVYAYGFRNVFGFDFDPSTGRLWATDNGPDPSYEGDPVGPGPNGGCNDEVNRVEKGLNYGWGPTGSCAASPPAPHNSNQDGPSPVLPHFWIHAASGITGARFCSNCGLGPELEGRLLYAKYDSRAGFGEIRAVTLSADRLNVVSDALVYRAPGASPLSIERGPDGTLYYSDSGSIRRLTLAGPTPTTTTTTAPTTTTTAPSGGGGGSPWVTAATPTRLRNDFSGWVGTRVVVGSADVRVSALGRWVAAGNSATHVLKLVDAATGADVPGGATTLATAGQPAGAFAYAPLPAPLTLSANRTYYLASEESAGGDAWYDYDTRITTTPVARATGFAWAAPGGAWSAAGGPDTTLGPLSFLYEG